MSVDLETYFASATNCNMNRFIEIEHKYIVDPKTFDKNNFLAQIKLAAPNGSSKVSVTDTYYTLASRDDVVLRHRVDNELQQLTLKSRGDDSESRLEINLNLGLEFGNQSDAVAEFAKHLGAKKFGSIAKEVEAFYFDNCEIVYYEATAGKKKLCVVEFEAKNSSSQKEALRVIGDFESKMGFQDKNRSKENLFDLLLKNNR